MQRLREAAERTQFIVATHSPALVNRLRPEEFVVCNRDEDGASIIPALTVAEVKGIVEESGEQPLGELWFSGVLGSDLTGGELCPRRADAWALLREHDGRWTVRQNGPSRIWDAVEAHITRWRGAGTPPLERFEITLTSEQPSITWPDR